MLYSSNCRCINCKNTLNDSSASDDRNKDLEKHPIKNKNGTKSSAIPTPDSETGGPDSHHEQIEHTPVKLPPNITRSRLYMRLKRRIEERMNSPTVNKKLKDEITEGQVISQETLQTNKENNLELNDESDDMNMANAFGSEKKNVGALLMAAVAITELQTDTKGLQSEDSERRRTEYRNTSERKSLDQKISSLITPE